jgi:hypothetical protein
MHIPTKGAPEALTEVLADRSDFYFSPLLAALPLLQEGRLQALAVPGSNRTPAQLKNWRMTSSCVLPRLLTHLLVELSREAITGVRRPDRRKACPKNGKN